jgi:hypothetical protein
LISVPSRVVSTTLDTLVRCGASRRECVVYWAGPQGDDRVDEVIHPRHRAGPVGYQVDQSWVIEYFLALSQARRRTLVQVHSHPATWVGHSETDDRFVLVPSVGFHSIVVPNFGHGLATASWGIWRLERDGSWAEARRDITWTND